MQKNDVAGCRLPVICRIISRTIQYKTTANSQQRKRQVQQTKTPPIILFIHTSNMNTQVHKRANRVSTNPSSSPLSVANGNGAARDTDHKRRRRLRRKQQKAKANKTMALLQAFMGATFLIVISFYAVSLVTEGRIQQKSKVQHNPMNLDSKNVPLGKLDKSSRFHKMKSKLKRMTQYKHSDYMEEVGDKSPAYAELRQKYDALLPSGDETSLERMKHVVKSLRKRDYKNMMAKEMPYDIHNCPKYPPANYPYAWNVKEVLDNWAPDDPSPRDYVYQGLCVFDFMTEKHKALNYREAELPFVVRDDPMVLRTAERWSQDNYGYIQKMVGEKTRYRTEYSPNNHFMYWMKPRKKNREQVPEDWEPPTEMLRMPYSEWLSHANITDEEMLGPEMEHWYFRLIGCGGMGGCDKDSSEYLFDELAFFQPLEENELYMVEPEKQKGIHCRFGMKGVIAENHFDGSRNMIALLGGERRYILAHPDQCENLNLLPRGHPSARHSAIDWSDPDWEKFPTFKDAEVNEVVMQAGDVLYLPTNWFHYIISLDLNFQCNTRSGMSKHYMDPIHSCGF